MEPYPTQESVQSTDALPLDPRPQTQEPENEGGVNDCPLDFSEPPPDWTFNVFLNNLADDVTDEEFKKIKHLFTGIIGKGTLNECLSLLDVFNVMRNRGFLSNDNLLYLQGMVMHIKRPGLLDKCIDYARTIGNVLHFYSPQESAADGFSFVKYHVEGKDFANTTRSYIHRLRNVVSRILFVPEQHIFIAGVEPSSSMLITLMIPQMYVDALLTLLEANESMEDLTDIGIDVIAIHDKSFNIRGIEEAEMVPNEQQAKLVNVYQQLKAATTQLEERETECLKLNRQLKTLDKREFSKEAMLSTLYQMFGTVFPTPAPSPECRPATLSSQSALREFKTALKYVEINQYDKSLISALLQANTTLVVKRLTEAYNLTYKRLYIEIEDLQSTVFPLTMELDKYKFVAEFDPEELEMVLFEKLVNAVKRTIQIEVDITNVIHYLNAAGKISRQLRNKEKNKLKLRYDWPDEDPITKSMNRDAYLFLSCLFLKEVEKTKSDPNIVTFIIGCLEEVGRKDLVKKFHELIKPPPVSAKQDPRKGPSTDKGAQGCGKQDTGIKQKKKARVRSRSLEDEDRDGHANTESLNMASQLKEMNQQIGAIRQTMEDLKGKPPTYDSLFAAHGKPYNFFQA